MSEALRLMGSGPLKTGSAPSTRSRPAPGWKGLPGTIQASPGQACARYGGARRAVEPFAPWGRTRL